MKPKNLPFLSLFGPLSILSGLLIQAETPFTFQSETIDSKVQIGYGLALEDVDGDAKPDILLADKTEFVWYQNPTWKRHVLVRNLTDLDNVCLAARDIDGDGKVEIAVGAKWNPGDTLTSGSIHYLVAPKDRTQAWTPIALPHEPTTHRMHWIHNDVGSFDLVVAPLHGRGNRNGNGDPVKIIAYRMNPQGPEHPWTQAIVSESLHMTHNLDPVNWDETCAEELLLVGREGIHLASLNQGKWTESVLASADTTGGNFLGAGEIRHGRLPNGTRYIATIEVMHGNQVVIYLQDKKGAWNRQVIDENRRAGHALACGDLLKKGFDHLVVGWRNPDTQGIVGIKIFTPNEEGTQWESSLLGNNQMACEDLRIADLNGDGKLDIVAAGRATNNLKVYWNQNP